MRKPIIIKIAMIILAVATVATVVGVVLRNNTQHEHLFGEWEIVERPTCNTTGTHERVCECGTIESEQLSKLEHNIVDQDAKKPNCTETGLTEGKHCSVCDEVLVAQQTVPALGHTEVVDKAVAPNCTETGLTEGKHCSVCDEVLVAQQTVPALGHTEVIDKAVASNCTETGLTEGKHCSVCDEVLVAQQIVPALGHTEVVDKAVAPNCTETGLTEGKHCSVCDEVLVAQQTVPALGHTEVVDKAVAPNCTETGLTEGKHCSVCDEVLVAQQTVPALGHTEVVDKAVAPNCTETGLTEGKHCSVCDEVLVAQQTVPALGHTEIIDKAVAPNCTEAGLTEGKHCSVCDEVLVAQQTVPALGHTEVIDKAVASNCTETGLTEGKHCSVCDEVLVAQQTVPALGHTEVIDKAVASNCTETGLTEGKHCSVCDEVLVAQQTVPALGHTEVIDKAVASNCTETGLTEGKHCSVCDEVLVAQQTVPALGHTEVVDKAVAPNCTETGLTEGKHCSVCDEVLVAQQTVPALGHTEVVDKAVAPNCTEIGLTEGKHCSVCDEVLVAQQTVPALGHTEVVDKAVAPNCTETGLTEGKHCSVCDEVLVAQQTVPALGHTEVVDKAVAPNCTKTGLTEGKHCSICDEVLVVQQIVPALGHTEIIDKAVAPNCTETGLTEGKHCSVCDKVLVVQEVIPSLGHARKIVVDKEASCLALGEQHTECVVCHVVLKTETIQYAPHDYSQSIVVDSNCIEDGCITAICTVCGKFKVDTIRPKGHSVLTYDEYVEATCDTSGYAKGYCDTCGEYITVTYPARGHVPGNPSYRDEYCGTQRSGFISCAECGITIYEFGHVYSKTVQYATCTQNGAYHYTCLHCGDSYSEEIKARGHVSGEWQISVEASCNKEGSEVLHCIACDFCIDSRSIEKVDHQYRSEPGNGGITYTCVYCFDSFFVQSAQMHTITFVSNGGTEYAPLVIAHGNAFSLPIPQREGYVFAGWYLNASLENRCLNTHAFYEDTTLYAGWFLSSVEGSIDSNNIITDVPVTFTFSVTSNMALTNANLTDYIYIQSMDGKNPRIYIASVSGNEYTIASDEYDSSMSYSVSILNSLNFTESSGYEFWFVTEGEDFYDIEYKNGVILLPESDIFSVYEQEEDIYIFLREDRLDSEDIVVVYGTDIYDIQFVMEVVAEGKTEGLCAYLVVAANADDVFSSYDVMYSGKLDVNNIEFEKSFEEEMTEQLLASSVYAEFEYTAITFASRVSSPEYTYKFKNITVKPSFAKKDTTLTIEFKITANFERVNKATGAKSDAFQIVLKLTTSLEFDVTARASSVDNFTFIVDVHTTVKVDLYASLGSSEKESLELSYFKKLFAQTREEGKFKELDSSGAKNVQETPFGSITIPFYGLNFIIDLSNVVSFEAVGEIGFSGQIDFLVSVGVQNTKSEGFKVIKSFKTHSSLSFYMLGKVETSNLVKIKATISLCGIVNAYIEYSCGPYFELGGMFTVSIANGGGANAILGGYIEAGLKMDIKIGVNAKLEVKIFRWKKTITVFDKSWTVFANKLTIISYGNKKAWLYFTETDEILSEDYLCGSSINLPSIVNTDAYRQDLTSMSKSIESANCKYYLVGQYANVTLNENGTLRINDSTINTITIKIKVVCGDIFKYATITFTMKHDEVRVAAKDATCTEDGYTSHTICGKCKKELDNDKIIISASGHKEVIDGAVDPTCDIVGSTEGSHCSVCSTVIVAQKTIPAIGHALVRHEGKNATCTESGWEPYVTCARCSYFTYSTIPAKGHSYQATVTAPTCTEGGFTTYTCHCGRFYEDDYIPSYGHTEVESMPVEPTCVDTGLTAGTHCSVCNTVLQPQEVIPSHGHVDVIDVFVEPTCTESGLTEGKHCLVCGEVLVVQQVIPSLGHTEIIHEAVAPNCTESGLTEGRFCSVCEEIFSVQQVIPALGHTEAIDAAVAPNCTETGLSEGKHCSVCEEILVEQQIVDVLGHTEVVDAAVPANCTENGLTEGKHCLVCGEILIEQQAVDALGHTEVIDAAVEPSCTETGLTEGKHCSVCDAILVEQQVIDDLGHTEVIDEAVAPECEKTGLTEGIHCSVCDSILVAQQSIPAPGHTEVIDEAVAPNCTVSGLTEGKHCSVCDRILLEQRNVPALGHAVVIDAAVAPTCVKTGLTEGKHCSRCETVLVAQNIVGMIAHEYKDGYCVMCAIWPDESMLVISETMQDQTIASLYTIPNQPGKFKLILQGKGTLSTLPSWWNQYKNSVISVAIGGENITVTSIFINHVALEELQLLEGVVKLDWNAFYGCTGLTEVSVPATLISFNEYAFSSCGSIQTVRYSGTIEQWLKIQFSGYQVVTSNPVNGAQNLYINGELIRDLVIPSGVTTIWRSVFYGYQGLTSVTMSNTVKEIYAHAFYGCTNLTSVKTSTNLAYMGEYSFMRCANLEEIFIPSSVTYVGTHTFMQCPKLTIYCGATAKPDTWHTEWNTYGCPVVWSYEFWDGSVGVGFDGGSGTVNDPYLISKAEQLAYLSNEINNNPENELYNKYYKLTKSIDLSGCEWIPIGLGYDASGSYSQMRTFKGVFDGNGYQISNFKITVQQLPKQKAFGLFGDICGGTVKNLSIDSFTIDISLQEDWDVGSIAGFLNDGSIISNCYVTGEINACGDVGGLVGEARHSEIINCGAIVDIQVISYDMTSAGGIAGYLKDSTVKYCLFVGDITGVSIDSSSYVGGIAGYTEGYNGGVKIDSCLIVSNVFSSSTEANSYTTARTIIGMQYGTNICTDCYYSETLTLLCNDVVIASSQSGTKCTISQQNSTSFYVDTLGWSTSIWRFSSLDINNGKYPTLK